MWEAFRLIDADGDGYITLMDLSDIASWAPDDFGTDFINDLIAELYKQSQVALAPCKTCLAPCKTSLVPCETSLDLV